MAKKKASTPTPAVPAVPAEQTPAKKRGGGCLRWGVAIFIALLVFAGFIANAPRTQRTDTPVVTLPTGTPTTAETATTLPTLPTQTAMPASVAMPATVAPTPTTASPTVTPEPPTATATVAPAPTTRPSTATAEPPRATATALPVPVPVANGNANLRSGPGTDYDVVGGVTAGQELDVVERNADGTWLRLATGTWIAASLVDGISQDLPISAAPVRAPEAIPLAPEATVATAPTATPVVLAAATQIPDAAPVGAFTCTGGCAQPPDPSCAIKGNVNSRGDKIYHAPGYRDYERTDIKPEEGDVWFCTEDEAIAAGFRAPLNH